MDMPPDIPCSLETNSITLIVLEVLASIRLFFADDMMSTWNIQEKNMSDTPEEEVRGTWEKTTIHFALYIPFYCLRTLKNCLSYKPVLSVQLKRKMERDWGKPTTGFQYNMYNLEN